MKRSILSGMTIAAVCLVAVVGQARAVTVSPTPADLNDLDHSINYTWGISYTVPAGQEISSATLRISKINDNIYDPTNALYIHLLDNPQTGVRTTNDYDDTHDYFAGQGVLVAKYVDHDTGYWGNQENLSYDFASLGLLATLNAYAANGIFGFGFDPDCHYDNCGIQFSMDITTVPHPGDQPVPEPVTMASLLLAVGALGRYVRTRKALPKA
jgi:hypothetical protein